MTCRRANDVSPTDYELERFLTKAYKKRINELNSETGLDILMTIHPVIHLHFHSAYAKNQLVRHSKSNTDLHPIPSYATYMRDYYCRELQLLKDRGHCYPPASLY